MSYVGSRFPADGLDSNFLERTLHCCIRLPVTPPLRKVEFGMKNAFRGTGPCRFTSIRRTFTAGYVKITKETS
jgi:hypothetical protein